MKIWRLHQAEFGPNDFTGSKIFGGRFNSIGTGALYASSSPSATILELRVHLKRTPMLPYKISYCKVAQSKLQKLQAIDIPGWDDELYDRPQAIGVVLLKDLTVIGYLVPSVTSSGLDSMVVLNPNHPDFASLKWTSYDFEFDNRLWL